MTREQEIQARVISPSIEDLKAALLACLRANPKNQCNVCYLHRYTSDLRLSTGEYCFAHLALEVAAQFDRLTTANAEQVARIAELETERDAAIEHIKSYFDFYSRCADCANWDGNTCRITGKESWTYQCVAVSRENHTVKLPLLFAGDRGKCTAELHL